MVDFSNLGKTEFEELCYDLIKAKGFTNLDWRKGTGKPVSPSDNSRDIMADKVITDIDKSTGLLRYFFECKHFEKGVPPTEIKGALTWAEAERPYCLVIIASNFLSNPCKLYIEKYIENNKPKFQIKIWENKTLELLLTDEKNICLNWKIDTQDMNYSSINKYHLAYTTKSHLNTVKYLFNILDNYNAEIRDKIFECIYFNFSIDLRLSKEEKYEEFKKYIIKNKEYYRDPLFVHQIITEVLAWAYHLGDIAIKEYKKNCLIEFKNKAQEMYGQENSLMDHLTKNIDEFDNRVEQYFKYYNDFCDNIVFDLLSEPFITNINKNISGD